MQKGGAFMTKKKNNNFKILWQYLKKDLFTFIFYIIMVVIFYIPSLISPYFWGKALEALSRVDWKTFITFICLSSGMEIITYGFLYLPRKKSYNKLEMDFFKNVSIDLYQKIINMPTKAFEEIGVGEFINRLYNDPDNIIQLMSQLIDLICRGLVSVAIIWISFASSYVLGIEVIILGIVMGTTTYIYLPKIEATQKDIKKATDEYVKVSTENISGIREIKALGIKHNIQNNVFKQLTELYKNEKKIRNYSVDFYSWNNVVYFLLMFILLATTGYFVIQGKIDYAVFLMINSYINSLDYFVEGISDFGVNYKKVSVSLNRMDEILNNKLYPDEAFGTKNLDHAKGHIKFNNVKFRYRDNENNTLNGLNLDIEPNKKIAIVGRSGNGKSTIFNLLLRYFDATEGSITIDGIDIRDLTEDSLRKNISAIKQEPFLFNMSIIDNFKLVKPDVTLNEIRKYCKEAYIDEYIMSLPKQYETVIGEGGVNLSGGQKQRLAIARTLLLNTKVILFDEATSALDNESQEYIKKTIDKLVKNHTIIIIAHRLSTIVDADTINIIEKGKLVDSGTHIELLANSKIYQELYLIESSSSNKEV